MESPQDPNWAVVALAEGALRGPEPEARVCVTAAAAMLERFVRVRLINGRPPAQFLEDCGQNVLSRVWQFRKTYRGRSEGEFWRWLGQICDHERFRLWSRESRKPRPLPTPGEWAQCDPKGPAAPDRTADAAALNEELGALRDCLKRLDASRRRVIELAYFAPVLPERAIAELLACSHANVHKLKAEALCVLRACLAKKGIQ
jgi:RNA polymerase sigma factor (sigma-70 family)